MNVRSPHPAVAPWNRPQLLVLAGANAVAAVILLGAWWASSREPDLGSQVPWLNVGVVAVLVAAGVDALWLGNGHSGVRVRRRALLADVARPGAGHHPGPRSNELVRLASGRRVHRADCPFVAGKATTPAELSSADRHCEMCCP